MLGFLKNQIPVELNYECKWEKPEPSHESVSSFVL